MSSQFDISELSVGDVEDTENSTLHKAAGILLEAMNEIPNLKDKAYPRCEDIDVKASTAFVPQKLRLMMTWLIDRQAYMVGESDYNASEETIRRSLSLAESLIFCKGKIITPLHLGLAAQLHHQCVRLSMTSSVRTRALSFPGVTPVCFTELFLRPGL